jgi:hypothetical protein
MANPEAGELVVLPAQDYQLNPGPHATTGHPQNLVDDHDVVHVVVVVVVVVGGVHVVFCHRVFVSNFL